MNKSSLPDDKLFFRLINNKSERTYWDYIRELRRRPSQFVFEKCAELIQDDNAKMRRIGIDVLAQLGTIPRHYYKDTLKLYFRCLQTENDDSVIGSLLFAIGHNNERLSKANVLQLCRFKNVADNFIKEGLISALLGVDNTVAINTLIELSQDKSGTVRNWATFGIGTQIDSDTESIREALWKRINDRNQDARFEAIVGLAKRKDARIAAIIEKELSAGDYQSVLFDAIIDLGDTRFLPILQSHLNDALQNEEINPYWLDRLKNCIFELTEKTTYQA